MKKYLYLLILCLILANSLTGCTSEPTSAKKDAGLTIDKIEEKYVTEKIGKVVKTSTYKDYVLVEYINDSDRQCFDLYNLKTGDRDIMELSSRAKIFNFSNGDKIVFESEGVSQFTPGRFFPFYIVCTRREEITGYDGDFHMNMTDLYKRIEDGVEFGEKEDLLISDLKVTLTGVEVLFAPMEGKEGQFYTAYSTIPVVSTSYAAKKNQFILEFNYTQISPAFRERIIKEHNGFINSVELYEKGENTIVTISLKDTAKFYSAKVDHTEPAKDDFPYVRFSFRNSIF